MNRVIIEYKPEFKPEAEGIRIYILDGIVMNPSVEETVLAGLDTLTAVRIRKTGKGNRNLMPVFVPET